VITDRDIEQIQRGYRVLNEQQAIDTSYVADDFVLEQSPELPGTRGKFHGPEGMERSFAELLGGFDAIRFEPQRFDVHGDWLIVPVTFWASVRGVEQRIEIIHIWQMRDGRAVRMRVLGGESDPLREIAKLS
jgi:ketosteroid isomerase-like protein